jgi:putative ABC transport system permease protein
LPQDDFDLQTAATPAAQSGGITVAAADTSLLATLGGTVAHGEFLNSANEHFPAAVLGWTAAQILGIADLRLPVQVDVSRTYFTMVGILRPVQLEPEIDDSGLIGFPVANSVLGYAGGATELYLRSYQVRSPPFRACWRRP